MNNKYLVSILLAAYNVEEYIEKCLETVCNQTYKHLEIIVVDDGSPDLSGEIVEKIAKTDSRVKLIRQKNQGLSGARNTGLEHATGDFVTFVDSDDYLAYDFVEYLLSIYENTGADVCLSENVFTTKDLIQVKEDNIKILTAEETVAEFLYPRIRMGVWNKLWKRSFLTENNFSFIPGQPTAEGLTFMTNAAQYINKSAIGKRKVYCYRLNNQNSATTSANVEKQGIGSLDAMNIIENRLDMSSEIIKNAMEYQKWSTSTYALRQIIDADAKSEYKELYKSLIKYIRSNSLKMLNPKVKLPLRMKCIAIARWCNPVWLTKLSLYLRDKHLNEQV